MTTIVPVNAYLRYIGVNDREKPLFEHQWPLPYGMSYNSYLLLDEKTALLDCVDANQSDVFAGKLREALEGRDLDYLIIHHVEPDHSATIPLIRALYPEVTLVGNQKTFEFLDQFYQMDPGKRLVVDEGDSLSLGAHSLRFYKTAMTHWPESMVSYLAEDKILFSQDIFGGFGALDTGIFDDQVADTRLLADESCRYYTNVVAKYSAMALRALKKLDGLEIQTILPVHGPLWRSHPDQILKLYRNLSKQEQRKGVLVAFGSMYGNTEHMAEELTLYLKEAGIQDVKLLDVTKTHPSTVTAEAWKYRGLILGAPTYNHALFQPMKTVVDILTENKMKDKILGLFGNYTWSGGALKALKAWGESQPYTLLEPSVEARSSAKAEDLKKLQALAQAMAQALAAFPDQADPFSLDF